MIVDKPKDLDRQREHHRHAAMMQQPGHQDEQEMSDDREYLEEGEGDTQEEEEDTRDRRREHGREYQQTSVGRCPMGFLRYSLGLKWEMGYRVG